MRSIRDVSIPPWRLFVFPLKLLLLQPLLLDCTGSSTRRSRSENFFLPLAGIPDLFDLLLWRFCILDNRYTEQCVIPVRWHLGSVHWFRYICLCVA